MHLKSMLEVTPTPLTPGFRLMPNDVIKLGRVRFKVREIVSPAYSKKLGKSGSSNNSKILNASKHEELPIDFKDQEIQYSPDVRVNQSVSALRGGMG